MHTPTRLHPLWRLEVVIEINLKTTSYPHGRVCICFNPPPLSSFTLGEKAERPADANTKQVEQKTAREPPTPHPGSKGGVEGGEGR